MLEKLEKSSSPEKIALYAANLGRFTSILEAGEALSFYQEHYPDYTETRMLSTGLTDAKKNLDIILKQLKKPKAMQGDIRYVDGECLIDTDGALNFLIKAGHYKVKLQTYVPPKICHWSLKSALTPEEAALIISGLQSFNNLDEARQFLKSEREADISFEILTEDDALSYERMIHNAQTILQALDEARELQILEHITASKTRVVIKIEDVTSWCTGKGVDLCNWNKLFPSNSEHNESIQLSSTILEEQETPSRIGAHPETAAEEQATGQMQEPIGDARSCLNPSHPHYSEELAAAVSCWNGLFLLGGYDPALKRTKKEQAKDWYKTHKPRLLMRQRKENSKAVDRLTTIINSDK